MADTEALAPFPPRTAGKVLADALAAGTAAARALDGDSMDAMESAADRVIRPFIRQLTADARMVDALTYALVSLAQRDAWPMREW